VEGGGLSLPNRWAQQGAESPCPPIRSPGSKFCLPLCKYLPVAQNTFGRGQKARRLKAVDLQDMRLHGKLTFLLCRLFICIMGLGIERSCKMEPFGIYFFLNRNGRRNSHSCEISYKGA